jgi:nucleotide-binding universal stress UspA family protein
MTDAGDPDSPENVGDDSPVTIVLAAVDTSTLASRVVDLAAQMVRRTWSSAQLHLVHVYRSGPFDRPARVGLRSEDLVAEARSYLDYHCRMARRQCPSVVVAHFAQGDPAEEILRVARSLSADFVIVGTHDHIGLEKLLLGSVAAKVAKSAPCPVLIYRQKQRPYLKATTASE